MPSCGDQRPPPSFTILDYDGFLSPFSLLPSALSFNLAVEGKEEKRLSVVYREIALIPTPLPLSFSLFFFFLFLFLAFQKAISFFFFWELYFTWWEFFFLILFYLTLQYCIGFAIYYLWQIHFDIWQNQKAISNARRCHVACFIGELNLFLLKPKQTATNSLTSVILLGFQTSYSNVVPHIKQYFEQHDCAYLSDLVQREKNLTSLVFTAVHGLEPEKNICLFSLINLFY